MINETVPSQTLPSETIPTETIPVDTDTTLQQVPMPADYVMPVVISRYPNPVPTNYAGTNGFLSPRDKTPAEQVVQDQTEELHSQTHGEPPLPTFNR